MMIVATVLMYTFSLEFQSLTSVIIHNQCSGIELISSVYFGNGAVCPKLSDQQMDISVAMRIRLEIYAAQDEFEGALLYKLQRNSHNHYSIDKFTIKTNKNEAKYVYMLVAWKMKSSRFLMHVTLVEHTKEFIWNEDGLKKLYDKNRGWLKEYDNTISDTWIVDDNMMLKITCDERDLKRAAELRISISEEERDNYAMRPLYVNLER
jgi:hypothetical protein